MSRVRPAAARSAPLALAALTALAAVTFAACDPAAVVTPEPSRSSPATAPTQGPATDRPAEVTNPPETAAPVTGDAADLIGEWYCYSYQPGVGTNSVNTSGIAGANSLLGSFTIDGAADYTSFYGADPGTFSYDADSGAIVFESGGMLGLEGTSGAGPNHDLIDLHGVGNGWNDPYVVYLICQVD